MSPIDSKLPQTLSTLPAPLPMWAVVAMVDAEEGILLDTHLVIGFAESDPGAWEPVVFHGAGEDYGTTDNWLCHNERLVGWHYGKQLSEEQLYVTWTERARRVLANDKKLAPELAAFEARRRPEPVI